MEGRLAKPLSGVAQNQTLKVVSILTNEVWCPQAPSLMPSMYTVLGIGSFKATENPEVTELTAVSNNILEEIPCIHLYAWYTEGTSRHTKQECITRLY